MKGPFFVKMQDTETTRELMRDKNAFALLAQIAIRARRKDGPWTGKNGITMTLKKGQAFIGDYESIGLTEKEYRCAKNRLFKCKLATFEGANKGTIATLINSDVFDISFRKRAVRGRTEGD